MDRPVSNDAVLGQPTRARLLGLLDELRRPAPTLELARRLGLHPNGVRLHLDRLRTAGLVVRRRVALPRGRPRDEWSLSPDAAPGGLPPRAYGDLARWLARAIPPRPGRVRDVERTGRAIGRELAPAARPPGPEAALRDTLTALGFQPLLERSGSGRVRCRLRNCPYRAAASENQEIVCGLHRGVTRGLLDVLEPGATLARFVPRDPASAGCEIEVEGLPPDPGSPPEPGRPVVQA